MRRDSIATFLVVAIATIPFSIGGVSGATVDELQKRISELQSSSSGIQKEVDKYQGEVNKTRGQINTLQGRLSSIGGQINSLEAQIRNSENQLTITELEIEQLRLKTNETEGNIDSSKEHLAGLLSRIHETDSQTLIEIILGHDSLSDFLRESANLQSLQDSMKLSLDSLKSYRTSLLEQKAQREAKAEELELLKDGLGVKQLALGQERSRQNVLLQQTKGEEREYQRLLSAAEREKAALFAEIAQLEQQVSIAQSYIKLSESGDIPRPGTKIFFWPEDNPVLTQRYGRTSYARSGAYGGAGHNGIDMASGRGSKIKSAQDGVIFASGTNGGWGNWVAVQHLGGLVTLYAHMIRPTHVATGATVKAGQVIGYEGSTGFSTGSHLHFSLYSKFFTYDRNGETYFNYMEGTLNPLDYL